jgi:hypothetical protein
VVQNLVCVGSHGISVGSLGQYLGEIDLAGKSDLKKEGYGAKEEPRKSVYL